MFVDRSELTVGRARVVGHRRRRRAAAEGGVRARRQLMPSTGAGRPTKRPKSRTLHEEVFSVLCSLVRKKALCPEEGSSGDSGQEA